MPRAYFSRDRRVLTDLRQAPVPLLERCLGKSEARKFLNPENATRRMPTAHCSSPLSLKAYRPFPDARKLRIRSRFGPA